MKKKIFFFLGTFALSFIFSSQRVEAAIMQICNQLDLKFRSSCITCVADDKHIWSAIGCLPTDLTVLIKDYIFTTGVGLAGSIAFLYFLYGAFMILTSAGNAEKIEEAKQIITSALTGLLLIIFSIFLLRVIGVDVLALPGFG